MIAYDPNKDKELTDLIQWFKSIKTYPDKPFSLGHGVHVVHPAIFFKSINREISEFPNAMRVKHYRGLLATLKQLKTGDLL